MAVVVGDLEDGTIPITGGVAGYEMTIKTVTFDSSYPTNGEPLTAAELGVGTVIACFPCPASGYVFEYDIAAAKLKAYWVDTTVDGAAMAEVANATNLATVVARVVTFGTPA